MNRIGIVYATKTKHSKKLAEGIGTAPNVEAKRHGQPKGRRVRITIQGVSCSSKWAVLTRQI